MALNQSSADIEVTIESLHHACMQDFGDLLKHLSNGEFHASVLGV
jgi:hypothetical protein